ncbi:ABC-type sugar transport system, periplasmic component [Galbibacter orientalis DSM 19592]|uniref:ABC-type sugar transport system, periplasmic component n=1 Tax=Galbibacter orientalis DSM 19592 TaxID=926559 RepID=I3CAS4_9FLAO|nr:extracellular solute-binding protein [Galbibacter orientalis]EIJ40717.1 ABC-type sugar transport system, periplasmic component [Galbibacter orientalis DSM 19592]
MSQKHILLKGITWDHSRGYTSAVATAQRFHELNPNVEIVWEKRSLQAFADEPIDQLAKRYDLLIIDHPWAGFAARTGVIISLSKHLPKDFLDDQLANSVGKSHESYCFDGYQSALAIDAATPVAASRPDLLEKLGKEIPKTWDDLMELAKAGKIAIPGIPQDTLMSFYMLCSTLGEDVAITKDYFISEEIGLKALDILRTLGQYINPSCFSMNPIKVYEAMTRTDKFVYSPFAYGYSNYSRRGYAKHILKFHNTVSLEGKKLITTLGGTGLAISSNSAHQDIALQYAQYVASPEVQKTIFFDNGGQPGHREAWLDTSNNYMSMDYFKDTLFTLDNAFLRPRYHGHMYFQDHAGAPIRDFMKDGGNAKSVLHKLNTLYLESLKKEL